MKIGDLVVATRKVILGSGDNRYFGILLKEEHGTRFIECGGPKVGKFSQRFWDVEVISENR